MSTFQAHQSGPFQLLRSGSEGMDDDPSLDVVSWTGHEELSAPYSFRVTLAADEDETVLESLLHQRVTLRASYDQGTVYFPGVVDALRRTGRHEDKLLYEIEVVPGLQVATEHQYQTRIFQEESVQAIVTHVLQEHGFAIDQDFRFELTGQYEAVDFRVQYHETDLAFIHRLLERDGIFYFFEYGEEREVVVFSDDPSSYVHVFRESGVPYRLRPAEGGVPAEEEVLDDFGSTFTTVPERIVLVDYNYRRENLTLRTEQLVGARHARGTHYEYALHFKTKQEGERLAQTLAEGFVARSRIFAGESTIRSLRCGNAYEFKPYEDVDDPLDGEYLMVAVRHEGDQSEAVFGGQEQEGGATYRNAFECIPADVPFRPERVTPAPRVNGFLTGVVESGGGEYADIDEEGRYVIRLHYDLSGREEAKATKRLRMMQPYGGAGHGMHLPLQQGAEVAVMCMDGDPDRPVVAGVLPNPGTRSPVTSENNSTNQILTRSNNLIELEDKEGVEKILLSTENNSTRFRIGSGGEEHASGVLFATDGEINGDSAKKAVLQSREEIKLDVDGGPAEIVSSERVFAHVGDAHQVEVDSSMVKVKSGENTRIVVDGSGIRLETDKQVSIKGDSGVSVNSKGAVDVTGTPIKLNS